MATLAEQLAEAKSIRHEWIMGRVARIYRDANGEQIEYSQDGLRKITAYIADLERQIAIANGSPAPNRPMRVWM